MSKKNAVDIAAQMRRSIADGTFGRSERLPPSRELAESLGVARNTLRSALGQLQSEGLLETRAGSGTYVTARESEKVPGPVEDAPPLELIDARFALEPHICRLCVLHGRHDDWEAMDALCVRMERAADDPIVFAEADTAFHRALAGATRNSLLIWLIGQINSVRSMDEWTRMRQLTLDERIIRVYNRQHRDVLDAMRARDSERAAAKMKEHLETARLSLTRALET